MQNILERLENLESTLSRLIRVGEVVGVDEKRGSVRVVFDDADGVVSYDLPVLFEKTHADKCIHMPDMGEHVTCVFLPNGQEEGFVLGAFYSKGDAVPVASRDKRHVRFKDGSWFEYDRSSHKLSGHVVGGDAELVVDKTAKLVAGVSATTQAPIIYLIGNTNQVGHDGGRGNETKNADTMHTGSYRLVGQLDVDRLVVRNDAKVNGDMRIEGDSCAGTRSGGQI